MTSASDDAKTYADELVAHIAPAEWHMDEHGEGKSPRCCAAVKTATGIIRQAQAAALRDAAEMADYLGRGINGEPHPNAGIVIANWLRARAAEIENGDAQLPK